MDTINYQVTAIDPGPKKSGIVIWNGAEIIRPEIISTEKLLLELDDFCRGSNVLAIECLRNNGGKVGSETFETAYLIGRLFERSPLPISRVYRGDVKIHHCRSMRANDSKIRKAIIERFGAPGTPKNPGFTFGLRNTDTDLWSAFAIATYAYDQYQKSIATQPSMVA